MWVAQGSRTGLLLDDRDDLDLQLREERRGDQLHRPNAAPLEHATVAPPQCRSVLLLHGPDARRTSAGLWRRLWPTVLQNGYASHVFSSRTCHGNADGELAGGSAQS
jgi:hypothetical protein